MPSFRREHPLASPPVPGCLCYAFLFRGQELLVSDGTPPAVIRWPFARLSSESSIDGLRRFGSLDQIPCFTGRWKGEVPMGFAVHSLRSLFGVLDDLELQLAGLAVHLLHWETTHAFCGVCGTRSVQAEVEEARLCPSCRYLTYPRIAPSIIVAVTKGDELLLARGKRFVGPMFSVLAGFVEPGETLEECVYREVREEVGIEVRDLRYFGSQPWPFPDSLMVGFTATYASGELRPDPSEILEAHWFSRDALPTIPGRYSIAGRLIDWFVKGG